MKWQEPIQIVEYDVLDDLGGNYTLSGNEGELIILPFDVNDPVIFVRTQR